MSRPLLILLVAGMLLAGCGERRSRYLDNCNFCDSLNVGDDYPAKVNFQYVEWQNNVCFKEATFGDTAIFSHGLFVDTPVFTGASFKKYVDFSYAVFQRPVFFDDVTFGKQVYFNNVHFRHYAKFTDLQETENVEMQFGNAVLPDTLDFSQNPRLACKIDLTTANFDRPGSVDSSTGEYKRPHYIFLFNTDISKFQLDYFHFRLLVPDSTITPVYGTKPSRITLDQKDAMYEALLNNFKQNGQEESYRRLDIEYQKFKLANSWARHFVWLPGIWWNYGYNKEYVVLWILISLFVFILINAFAVKVLNKHVYEVLPPKDLEGKLGVLGWLWQSGVYTCNIFFRLTLDRECMRFRKFWATVYFLVIYILGVLCLGYLANFILQH